MGIWQDCEGCILIVLTGQENILDAYATEVYVGLCIIILTKSSLAHKTVLEGGSMDHIHALRGHSQAKEWTTLSYIEEEKILN